MLKAAEIGNYKAARHNENPSNELVKENLTRDQLAHVLVDPGKRAQCFYCSAKGKLTLVLIYVTNARQLWMPWKWCLDTSGVARNYFRGEGRWLCPVIAVVVYVEACCRSVSIPKPQEPCYPTSNTQLGRALHRNRNRYVCGCVSKLFFLSLHPTILQWPFLCHPQHDRNQYKNYTEAVSFSLQGKPWKNTIDKLSMSCQTYEVQLQSSESGFVVWTKVGKLVMCVQFSKAANFIVPKGAILWTFGAALHQFFLPCAWAHRSISAWTANERKEWIPEKRAKIILENLLKWLIDLAGLWQRSNESCEVFWVALALQK